MQSGTTGINVNRMYNPIKQSRDQDPDGRFIRQWVPELAGYSDDWIHEPWRAPQALQRRMGAQVGKHDVAPIADPVQAARDAKARLTAFIPSRELKPEAQRIRSNMPVRCDKPAKYAKSGPQHANLRF